MNKIRTYKTFENVDVNFDEKINQVLENLVKKKVLIAMLADTITHVSETIEEIFPKPIEDFMDDVKEYDEHIYECLSKISDDLIEGFPNIKDMMDDIEWEFNRIDDYLKRKKISDG